MSQIDQTELSELRQLLQGALADLEVREGTIAALRETIRERDAALERLSGELRDVRAERDRLREEKGRAWDYVLDQGGAGRTHG